MRCPYCGEDRLIERTTSGWWYCNVCGKVCGKVWR